ncbi:MAG: hypothetical protein ACI32E_02600, partial [Bacilli bacterium]
NKIDYGYSPELVEIIEKELLVLLDRIDNEVFPFDAKTVLNDYAIYCKLKQQAKNKIKKTSSM